MPFFIALKACCFPIRAQHRFLFLRNGPFGKKQAIMTSSDPMVHAITVDVEDYFHTEAMSSVVPRHQWDAMPFRVERNTRVILESFARHNVRGTFFFLGWVAKRFPGLVKEVCAAGHELACHSFFHQAIFRLSPKEFREDTVLAKSVIEDAAGEPICGYRAPSFSMTPGTDWAIDILGELGFTYDSSVNPIKHDFYSNANAPRMPHKRGKSQVTELPIATARIFGTNFPCGGGAYLRFFPQAYFRFAVQRLAKEGAAGMFYLHPWEVDPDQPRLRASWKSKLRQYTGLRRMQPGLEALISRYRFAPIREIYPELDARRPIAPDSIGKAAN